MLSRPAGGSPNAGQDGRVSGSGGAGHNWVTVGGQRRQCRPIRPKRVVHRPKQPLHAIRAFHQRADKHPFTGRPLALHRPRS